MPWTPEQKRENRKELKAAGLCTRCSGVKDDDAKAMCINCLIENNEWHAAKRMRV